ncbi:hypothetical protein [Glycomyces xiaoerkulensis]|uniref:hypothetical protein n=1 Tax=Glycomyces xiaoerkulensis TaxID=2038139 RepID=UPI000C2620FF|nr:hypothetical protein [Glycomyces xiaoerkulensis]
MALRPRASRRVESQSPVSLAGWLFADLALLLFIITIVVVSDFPAAALDDGPEETAPAPSPSPTPSPTPEPTADPGVEPEPLVFYVDSDAAGLVDGSESAERDLVDDVAEHFEPLIQDGSRVGFMLTFGGASDPGYGGSIAAAANEVMAEAYPDLFGDAPTRHFWTSSGKEAISTGTLQIELYLLVA